MATKRSSDTSAASAAPARRKTATTARTRKKLPASLAEVAADAVLAAAPAEAVAYVPEYQEVAALAYSYWEARGCQGGAPEEDWLRAEQELRARGTSAASA